MTKPQGGYIADIFGSVWQDGSNLDTYFTYLGTEYILVKQSLLQIAKLLMRSVFRSRAAAAVLTCAKLGIGVPNRLRLSARPLSFTMHRFPGAELGIASLVEASNLSPTMMTTADLLRTFFFSTLSAGKICYYNRIDHHKSH